MRPTLLRTVALSAAILGGVTAFPAHAAAPFPAVTITDPSGDGNGLNGQGQAGLPGTSTPSEYSGGDILSLSWRTLGTAKRPAGFQVAMRLAGPPATNTVYRVTTKSDSCGTFWLVYTTAADSPPFAALQHNCPGFTPDLTSISNTESDPVTATVKDSTITWTLPPAKLPRMIEPGEKIRSLSGHTRLYAGSGAAHQGSTPVEIDEISGEGTFTYGR